MLFKSAIFTAALVCSASAIALEERAPDPILAPLVNVPEQCRETCAILAGLSSVDPANLATLSAVCKPEITTAFTACMTCFQTNSPETFTPELLTALQSSVDQLGTGCLLIGSPVSSIVVPTPTGGASSPSSGSGSAGVTPAPLSSAPAASTSSRASGAIEVTASRAGLLALFSAIGAAFFL